MGTALVCFLSTLLMAQAQTSVPLKIDDATSPDDRYIASKVLESGMTRVADSS